MNQGILKNGSTRGLKLGDILDSLLSSMANGLEEHGEEVQLYNWIKEKILDGRDFTYPIGKLHEIMVAKTKQLLQEIGGRSRDRLPSQEEDDVGLEVVTRRKSYELK